MKKFIKFAAAAIAAIALFGCAKDPQGGKEPGDKPSTGNTELTQDLTFTVEVTSVESDLAKVKVQNNGTTKDTWYFFATTETDVEKAITAKVAELTADGGKVTGLKKSTSTTVTVRDLEPETDYTFIVFGLTAEGEVYGNAESVEFSTAKGKAEFQENPAWSVAYTGEKEYDGDVYEHTATVTSSDQNPWFLSSAWPKEEFEAAMEEYGIEAILQYELDNLNEYIDQVNKSYGYNFTILDWLYVGTDWDTIDIDAGKEYYVMAVGVGEDGELSGLYAISDVISLPEEDPTEAYSAWIGDWTFTGANGATYNVTFEKDVNNKSYLMTGWQEMAAIPTEVTWFEEDGMWAIMPQEFGTYTIDEQGTQANIYFLGAQKDEEGYSIYTDVPVCVGIEAEGQRIAVGYSDEEEGLAIELMSYFAVINNKPYFWDEIELLPTFPITITEAAAAPAERPAAQPKTAERKFTSKRCPKFLPAKTFGNHDFIFKMF